MVRYPHGVIDRELPSSGERLGHDWALQDPDDWVLVLEDAIQYVVDEASVDPAKVVGLGDRLHLLHRAAGRQRGRPAMQVPALPAASARVAEAVEAPRGAAGRRPAQRGGDGARGGVLVALWRPDLVGVVLPEADRGVARGPGGLRRGIRVHRSDRLGDLVADRQAGSPELHRRLQGAVVARRADSPRVGTSRRPILDSTRPPRSSGTSSSR